MSRYDELLRLINTAGVAPGIGPWGQGYHMEQMPTELALFLDACFEKNVQSMLELGTGEYGGVARFCTEVLHWDVTIIDVREPVHRSGRFLLGNTTDEQVFQQVKDQRFDLVLIDADHSYTGVANDHARYAPLASKIVALHDIAPGREDCRGVTMFWNELAYTPIAGGFAEICRDHPERRALKDGYHELIDLGHPIGIGWYSV